MVTSHRGGERERERERERGGERKRETSSFLLGRLVHIVCSVVFFLFPLLIGNVLRGAIMSADRKKVWRVLYI